MDYSSLSLNQGSQSWLWTFGAGSFFVFVCWGWGEVGGCPVHRRILSSISVLDQLAASSNLFTSCDNQKCLQTLPSITLLEN